MSVEVGGTLEDVMGGLTDVTALSIVAVLESLCRDETALGWDRPPRLALLERSLPAPRLADELRDGAGVQLIALKVSDIGFPSRIAEGGGAAITAALRSLAGGLRDNAELAAELTKGRDLLGWLFTFEAWGLFDEAGRAYEAEPEATRGLMKDRPERVEARMVWAVDRSGLCYGASQVRGQDEPELLVADTGALSGRIIDALAELVEVLP